MSLKGKKRRRKVVADDPVVLGSLDDLRFESKGGMDPSGQYELALERWHFLWSFSVPLQVDLQACSWSAWFNCMSTCMGRRKCVYC